MNRAHVAFVFAACALLFSAGCVDRVSMASAPTISFVTSEADPAYGSVIVSPIDEGSVAALAASKPTNEDWLKILSVRAGEKADVAMIGSYQAMARELRFTPRFKPTRGVTYVATFDADAFNARSGANLVRGGARVQWVVAPLTGPSTTVVSAIYPSTDSVPMNLLRIYIQFSAPMSVGDNADERVRLVDETGKVVPDAFLIAANRQELWDPKHTRLTLFFDPGRIKRDLVPHEALGLPLRAGHSYRLVIDSTWHDAQGRPLKASFEKRFKVGPVDRTFPRTGNWKFSWPRSGQRGAIDIQLPEPLDYPMLMRMITVKRSDGSRVTGVVEEPTSSERRVAFVPDEPWKPGEYYVEVDAELEDLAGNNLKKLFDVAPGDTGAFGIKTPTAKVPFRIR